MEKREKYGTWFVRYMVHLKKKSGIILINIMITKVIWKQP